MRPVSGLALWFGLWGAPAAWSLQLMIDYAFAAHACFPHRTPLAHPTGGALDVAMGAAAVGALAIALGALVVAVRSWRRIRSAADDGTGPESPTGAVRATLAAPRQARMQFMAAAGIMTSAVFTFGIALNVVSPALVFPCW